MFAIVVEEIEDEVEGVGWSAVALGSHRSVLGVSSFDKSAVEAIRKLAAAIEQNETHYASLPD